MLKLIKMEEKYRLHLEDMMEEWYNAGEKIVPYAIIREDYKDFGKYLESLEVKEPAEGWVPDSTYFCIDEDRNKLVGAINIRHYLNEQLLLNVGHIGVGVRPSERRKGIATKMINLALNEFKNLKIDKALMVCNKNNIGSAKSIQNNGGVLENEVLVNGEVIQRYWIKVE